MHVAGLLEKRNNGLRGRDLQRILAGLGVNSQQLERMRSEIGAEGAEDRVLKERSSCASEELPLK
jgi:hypothetical protein